MQEAIELLKKVLSNEGDIGMHIEWNVGFREGIEHCIATLEAAQQNVQADAEYCPRCEWKLNSDGSCINGCS